MFAAFLTSILFSLSAVCAHRSTRLIGGTEANFWRLSVAFVCLALWAYGFGRGLEGEALPLFLLSGVLGIGVGDVAYFQALPRLGTRLTVLLSQCFTPACGALLEWLWLGTRLTIWQVGCSVVMLSGVALVLGPGEHFKRSPRQLVSGIFGCAVSALGVAGGAVMSRRAFALAVQCGNPIDPLSAGFQRVVGGFLVAAVLVLIAKRHVFQIESNFSTEQALATSRSKWRRVWLWVLLNGLAGQTLGVTCMQWALQTTPTGIVLAIIALTPVVVIPFAWAFEGERPTLRSLLGAGVAVAGAIALVFCPAH